MTETKITIFYGPLSEFEKLIDDSDFEGLVDAVYARDELFRQFRVLLPGDESSGKEDVEELPRPKRLIARSGDYGGLKEHVVANFPGLIRTHNPEELILHNPPSHVHSHLERAYKDSFEVIRYSYPLITQDSLVRFHSEFEQHLIGQLSVKESLLAALYPLTRDSHKKPVVVMFYGPSGVGKTETAAFINGLLGGELMRRQFSMFHSENFASYLFGGSHSELSFARDLLERESGVVLIDEFDKAAAVFHSAFYQFFDGGVFEDKNYRADVGRGLIICTSNYGTEREIRDALGDALYSRFDALIQFESLSQDEALRVLDRLVERRIADLDDDEKAVVSVEEVLTTLRPLATSAANVRKLGKQVDELVSILLVERLVLKVESPST